MYIDCLLLPKSREIKIVGFREDEESIESTLNLYNPPS